MKYLLITLGVLLAIPVIPYLIGLFIPQEHTATVSRDYDAGVGKVWSAVTGVREYPEWRTEVDSVSVLSDSAAPLRWTEYYTNNDAIMFEEALREDSTRFSARISSEQLPFGGSWTYRLEQTGGDTRLTITEDGEIYNPIFRFISKFIMGYEGTLNGYLDDLEQTLN